MRENNAAHKKAVTVIYIPRRVTSLLRSQNNAPQQKIPHNLSKFNHVAAKATKQEKKPAFGKWFEICAFQKLRSPPHPAHPYFMFLKFGCAPAWPTQRA